MKIHDKIRFMREEKGWSREEMASKLEMSPNGYANIERGETDVQLSRLEQIAEVLGIELLDLFTAGERNVIYLASNHNQLFIHFHGNWQHSNYSVFPENSGNQKESQLKFEQQEKEISYLKEIINLMKKS